MISIIFEELIKLPETVWDIYALRNEPLRYKLTEEKQAELFKIAHETGKSLAKEVKEKYPNLKPEAIAHTLGLKVDYLPLQDEGSYIRFACYTEPDKIEIYQKTVDVLCEKLKEEEFTEILNETSIRDILLSHELYHYFEYTKADLATSQKLLTLWRIGPFEYKSRVVSLQEVGAMSFAKELLHLQYSPYVLDILLLYPQNKVLALELFDYVRKLGEQI